MEKAKGWEIDARGFCATGPTAYAALDALITTMKRNGHPNPAVLVVSVSFAELELYEATGIADD